MPPFELHASRFVQAAKTIKTKRRLDPIYNFSNPKEGENCNSLFDSEKFFMVMNHHCIGK